MKFKPYGKSFLQGLASGAAFVVFGTVAIFGSAFAGASALLSAAIGGGFAAVAMDHSRQVMKPVKRSAFYTGVATSVVGLAMTFNMVSTKPAPTSADITQGLKNKYSEAQTGAKDTLSSVKQGISDRYDHAKNTLYVGMKTITK